MSIFNNLKDSLTEAVDIKHGRKAPSRVTRYEVADVKALRESLATNQAQSTPAVCISVDTAWAAMAEQRLIELESGEAQGVSWDEIKRKLKLST